MLYSQLSIVVLFTDIYRNRKNLFKRHFLLALPCGFVVVDERSTWLAKVSALRPIGRKPFLLKKKKTLDYIAAVRTECTNLKATIYIFVLICSKLWLCSVFVVFCCMTHVSNHFLRNGALTDVAQIKQNVYSHYSLI